MIMLVIIGHSSAQHCVNIVVGIGSRSHDLFWVDNISLWTSIVATGWNTTSLSLVYPSSVGGGIDVLSIYLNIRFDHLNLME